MFEARQSLIASSSRPGRPGALVKGRAMLPGEAAALIADQQSKSQGSGTSFTQNEQKNRSLI